MKLLNTWRFVSVAAALLPLSAQAQLIKAYGAKVGANSSKVTFSYVKSAFQYETDRRTGFNAALFLEWGNLSVFSFITELEYAQRGFTEEQIETDEMGQTMGVVHAKTRLDYVSLPIMIKLQYPRLVTGPYLIFGPRVDFLVNRVAGKYEFSTTTIESPLYKVFADQALSGAVGLGMAVDKLLHVPLLIETRYNFVLTHNTDLQTISKAQSQSFDLWFGIKL